MATRNRAAQLGRVLERYCDLQSPPGGWKAIVVDNGSSDETRGVVQSFVSRIPVEYIREDRGGKMVALNAGIPAIAGEVVVLTDDRAQGVLNFWRSRSPEMAWAHSAMGGLKLKRSLAGAVCQNPQVLVKDGHRVWWLSDLVVEHVVRPEQFRRSWIWRRTVRYGRGTYRQDAYEHPEPPFLFGMPRYAIRQVASEGLRAVLAALAGRRKQCFEALWMIAFTWGQLVEGRRMRKENAPR